MKTLYKCTILLIVLHVCSAATANITLLVSSEIGHVTNYTLEEFKQRIDTNSKTEPRKKAVKPSRKLKKERAEAKPKVTPPTVKKPKKEVIRPKKKVTAPKLPYVDPVEASKPAPPDTVRKSDTVKAKAKK